MTSLYELTSQCDQLPAAMLGNLFQQRGPWIQRAHLEKAALNKDVMKIVLTLCCSDGFVNRTEIHVENKTGSEWTDKQNSKFVNGLDQKGRTLSRGQRTSGSDIWHLSDCLWKRVIFPVANEIHFPVATLY